MQSLISRHKFGNCDRCPKREVPCVKRKKEMVCLNCAKIEDVEKQTQKAKRRDAARCIGQRLRSETGKGENDLIHSRNNLIQDLDAVQSKYIRILYADANGVVSCYTCPTSKHYTLMQNGHYISRSNLGLRWDDRNNRPQCSYCNCNLNGNLEVYKERLDAEDVGLSDQLYEQSKLIEKPTNDELKLLLIEKRAKLKLVETKLVNKK